MDLMTGDVLPVIRASHPHRFSDLSPQDFEILIARLFKDMGYAIDHVKHGADFGVDVLAVRGPDRLAIQVKRYKGRVGVNDINQVIGGKNYYKCTRALVVTTSGYTSQGNQLALQTNTEIWDWHKLERKISETYMQGKSYYDFFGLPKVQAGEDLVFEVLRIDRQPMKGNYLGVQVYVRAKNVSGKNLQVQFTLPEYLKDNSQFRARHYLEGYFNAGTIFSGYAVECCFVFDAQQVGFAKAGDRLVVTYATPKGQRTVVTKLDTGIPRPTPATVAQPSSCFIATAAYGTPLAPEIETLRRWRDAWLSRKPGGTLAIRLYYFASPPVASLVWRHERLAFVVSRVLARLVTFLQIRGF